MKIISSLVIYFNLGFILDNFFTWNNATRNGDRDREDEEEKMYFPLLIVVTKRNYRNTEIKYI